MGIFDTPTPTAYPTSSSSSISYPAFYQNAMQQVLNMGLASAAQPFQPYGQDRIAPLSVDELRARDVLHNNVGAYQPGLNSATNFLSGVSNQLGNTYNAQPIGTGMWGQAAADQYMSPYIGSVIDRAKRETNRDFDIQNNRIKDAAVAAGAFGGSRHGIVESNLERQRGQRLDDITTTGLNNAYLNAQQIFGTDQNRGLQAQIADESARRNAAALGLQNAQIGIQGANSAQNLGRNAQAGALADVTGLMGLGSVFRNQTQASRDFDYSEFLRNQGYDEGQANFLSGIVRGLPNMASTSSTGQQYIPGVSTASQIAGLGTTLLGGIGALSNSGLLGGISNLWNSATSSGAQGLSSLFNTQVGSWDWGVPANMLGGEVVYPFAEGGLVSRGGKLRGETLIPDNEELGKMWDEKSEEEKRAWRQYQRRLRWQMENDESPRKKEYARGGLVSYASGGLAEDMDDNYLAQESSFDFNGKEIGAVMSQLDKMWKQASDKNDAATASQIARKMHGLYPLLKANGPDYIIGSQGRPVGRITQEMQTPMPSERASNDQGALPAFIPDAKVNGALEGQESVGYPAWLPGGGGFSNMKSRIFDYMTTPVENDRFRTLQGEPAYKYSKQGIAAAPNLNGLPSPEESNLVEQDRPDNGTSYAPAAIPTKPRGKGLQPRSGLSSLPNANDNPYPLMEEANLVPQEGLGAAISSGQNKLSVATSPAQAQKDPAKDPSLLDSPWLPVIAAGLRMMEAKPGQSFVQNLGGAGGAAINTMQAQREDVRKERDTARKAALEERKVGVTEGELEAKKPYYASQAEYLRYKGLAEKYEKMGTTAEGDVIVRDITQDGPGSLRILDGVKSEKWLTAKAGKEIQQLQNADNNAARREIAQLNADVRREEIDRKSAADADRNEKGFGAEFRAQQGAILKRRSESGDMSGTIKFEDEVEAYRHANTVFGDTKAARAKQQDLGQKLEQRVQMARDQAKKTLKGKDLQKQLDAIEQYNRMNRLQLGLE